MTPIARAAPLDARLLTVLERAFAEHAGDDERIDAEALRRALGFRSEELAQRVFHIFDANGDGAVARDEFLAAVRAIVLGTTREKLWFAFRLHDANGDGSIDLGELRRMTWLGLAEDDVSADPATIERLARALLAEADANHDGLISFDEFVAVLERHPEVLEQMTRSEARWLVPNEDLLARADGAAPGWIARAGLALRNRALPATFLGLWIVANVVVFVVSMIPHARGHGGHGPPPFDLARQLSGAATSCITFDAFFVLVPVLRRFLTWVRATKLHRVIPVDEAIDFHRIVGDTLFGLAILHGVAQIATDTSGKRTLAEELARGRVVSGLALLVVFAVMWFFARAWIRRSGRFELFYFTHLLYVPWIALALVHAAGVVGAMAPALVGLVVELVVRRTKRAKRTEVLSATALRSGVTRLEIARPPAFAHRPADYLFLRVPAVARHEWHPFTISSAPERELLTVHVRSLGNWSSALRSLAASRASDATRSPIEAYVDGPYGSPSTHVFAARNAVLIGAGIGVTPFASILESIVLRERDDTRPAPKKVHFFWLNRDQYSFEWFAALLASLEREDLADRLDVRIHMTGGHVGATAAGVEVARELLHVAGVLDLVTGLRTKTRMGHPDWRAELAAIQREHAPEPIHVFFCGPPGLGATIRPICDELGVSFRDEKF